MLFDDTTAHHDLLREVLTDPSHAATPRQALLQAVDRMLAAPVWSLEPDSELVPVRARLISTEPALRARALLRVADVHAIWARTLHEAFSGQLDQVEAAALAGAAIGAVLGAAAIHLNSGAGHGSLPETARKAARSVLAPGAVR
ncbi:hypothetical protein ACIBHY_10735 [Nonomuraea sp. NPDC050547]|uniref:hypothetical protein n=1 Tax=Nonomuraea sp. NPDC050547 TaxID=3364368 RepID=UPI0037B1A423